MEELVITPSTVVLLAIILVGVVFAVRRLVRRGPCDCGDHCGEGGCHGGAKRSSCCAAADKMVEDMNARLKG